MWVVESLCCAGLKRRVHGGDSGGPRNFIVRLSTTLETLGPFERTTTTGFGMHDISSIASNNLRPVFLTESLNESSTLFL